MSNLVRVVVGGGVAPTAPITFSYTGNIQTWTVPATGTYQLEVYGAEGQTTRYDGFGGSSGLGGYAKGNVKLKARQKIYICIGGAGSGTGGGYNGGGNGNLWYDDGNAMAEAGGGGGATHIGKSNALLKNTAVADLFIVAGGGGGGARTGRNPGPSEGFGGGGGGTAGANGYANGWSTVSATGGTQSTGYAYGQGGNSRGGQPEHCPSGGGGGGYYGGQGGYAYTASGNKGSGGGAGGSGYTDGCISGTTSMQIGQRSGHGYARITYIGK